MLTGRFIPTAEIRRLAEGCYEHTVFQVSQLAKENSPVLFGRAVQVEVVGTFPGAALLLSEDGALVRMKYERAANGQLKLLAHEDVRVSSFTPGTVEDYARQQASRAVKLWMEGRTAEAQQLISEVAPYVDPRPARDDAKVVEAVIVAYRANRPWKQLYREKAGRLHAAVGQKVLAELRETAPQPKFGVLYDGSLTESERGTYADLLRSDFSYLSSRVSSLRDLVEACYEPVSSVVRSEQLRTEEAIVTFAAFTEDLISDLKRLSQVVADAPKQVMTTENLAKLYDSLVEGFGAYEIAGKFVEQMSQRLSAAAQ